MGHCPPPTVGPYEDPHSGRSPCLRKRAAGGLTGLWGTKLSSVRHAQELAGRTRTRKKQKVTIRALIAESHEMSVNSEMGVNSVLVTARPNATPLGHPCTQRQGDAQRRAHTRRPRLHHTGGFVCGQGPMIKRFCRARAAGEARPVRVACPLPALHALTALLTPRPWSRAARTRPRHAPAPALPQPPAPVHAARASRWPAPALPPQRARRKAPWLFAIEYSPILIFCARRRGSMHAHKRYVGELGMKRTSGSKIRYLGAREACRCMRMKNTSGSLRRAQKIMIGERVKGTSGSLA